MISFWSILIVVDAALFVAAITLGLIAIHRSRAAKSRPGESSLIGSIGRTVTDMAPHGAVVVNGELWPATVLDAEKVGKGARITVVGPRGHLLAVTALQKS